MDNIDGSIKRKPSRLTDTAGQADPSINSPGSETPSAEDEQITRIKPIPEPQNKTEPMDYRATIGLGSILKGRFIIDKEIARGGMGVVYRARDFLKEQFQDRNPFIAIKVLSEQCKAHSDFLIALQREAVKAQKLAHPNIVIVHDFDSDGTNVFMTMEYLEGETLQAFLAQRNKKGVALNEALALIKQMGQGLAYAHQKGIVHCDFKPGNVFLTHDNTVKILDFGIARASSRPEQNNQDTTRFDAATLGALTPTYASCELLEKANPDPRDDIYSLACVSYELITGRHPFNRVPATAARDSKLKPAPIKELSKQQWNALLRGLAFERDARPDSVTEYLAGLNNTARKSNRSRGAKLVTILVLAGLISFGFYFALQNLLPNSKTISSLSVGENGQGVSTSTVTSHTPMILSAEQQNTVARLLEAAEIHFMVKRITEPVGSNAYEAYLHVLEIDPENETAKAGLQHIADYYQNQAQNSLTNDETKQALEFINTGLMVMPQHVGLKTLKQQLDNNSMPKRLTSWFYQLWH